MPTVRDALTVATRWKASLAPFDLEPETANPQLPPPVFHDPKRHIRIYRGDCLQILAAIPENCVDLIFADPPYFLSNDGIPPRQATRGAR